MAIDHLRINCNKLSLPIYFFILIFTFSRPVVANEMPLEGFPANGIVVHDERNVQIEREDLYIKSNKIVVSYMFRNVSDKDITSEVAFPIPPHQYGLTSDMPWDISYPLYSDFTVEVDGAKQQTNEITHALVKGKDITDTLQGFNISIKDFNESRWVSGFSNGFFQQSKAFQQRLIDNGIVKIDDRLGGELFAIPAWSVETTYFWKQAFPARSVVAVKITYRPNPSHTKNPWEDKAFINRNRAIDPWKTDVSEILCLNDELKNWKKQLKSQMNTAIVDYILTTANHWKKPIKEFHLIIEADSKQENNERVSTCFERNRLVKINDYRYELTIKDFEPKEEISVYFMSTNLFQY